MDNQVGFLKPISIVARDIPDAWFQCVFNILDDGYRYVIDQGSFEGSERIEFDDVRVRITHPHMRPLEPDIPPSLGIPAPVAPDYIDTYFNEKIMIGVKDENEDYVYGERLSGILVKRYRDGKGDVTMDEPVIVGPNQIEAVIERYQKYGFNTNQTTMEVGRPDDCLLNDPPCLRLVDCRVRYGKLHFFVYFRSWDLWGGFPANLGGLQMLKEDMAKKIGVEPGETIAYSKGLHLYKYIWELAQLRTGIKKEELNDETLG